jgi:hypothetical protein
MTKSSNTIYSDIRTISFAWQRIRELDDQALLIDFDFFETGILHLVRCKVGAVWNRIDCIVGERKPAKVPSSSGKLCIGVEERPLPEKD